MDASDITRLTEARQELERYSYLLPGFAQELLATCREQVRVARKMEVEKTAEYQDLIDVANELAGQVIFHQNSLIFMIATALL